MIYSIVNILIFSLLSITNVTSLSATSLRIPRKFFFTEEPPALPAFDEDSVFVIFPGAGGPDPNIERIIEEVKESDKQFKYKRFVYCYDWSKWRGNIFNAAYNGQHVGKIVGRNLGLVGHNKKEKKKQLKNIHIIGISVGAFAADSCIREYKKTVKYLLNEQKQEIEPAFTRVTFLDPFTSRGVIGQNYGQKHFGKRADYCENYLNTDDPVPFTNDPLPHAFTFDVTESKERELFKPLQGDSMHSWPVAFYGLNWRNTIDPRKKNTLYSPKHCSIKERGAVFKMP